MATNSAATYRPTGIATGRVPEELRAQGNELLYSMGSTPSELICSAYEYLLEHKALPGRAHTTEKVAPGVRTFSADEEPRIRQFIAQSTLKAPASWKDKTFAELREEASQERFETYLTEERA